MSLSFFASPHELTIIILSLLNFGAICKEITNSIKKRQNVVINATNVVKRLKNKIK